MDPTEFRKARSPFGSGRTIVFGAVTLVATVFVYSQCESGRRRYAPGGAAGSAAGASRPREGPADGALSPDQERQLVARLRRSSGSPVWFVVDNRYPVAIEYAHALERAFEAAGFQVRSSSRAAFPLRPGISVFAADEQPPDYVATVVDAFKAAGIEVVPGTGYRSYYEEMKRNNPAFQGFELAPDQTYLVVVSIRAGPRQGP